MRSLLWTCLWIPVVLVTAAFMMLGDPVDGGYEKQALLGRAILFAGGVIWLVGFWLIQRRRER
jgi:hypothetical protein